MGRILLYDEFTMTDSHKTGPKDVFMQLGSILGLYVSVFAIGALVFQIINLYFSDVLAYEYGYYTRQGLRWPLSVLVIIWPLLLWLNSYIQKDLAKYPPKRELKTRKWLLYFTVFAATLVIVGDSVTLIFSFLSGELTVRFLLKVVSVLAIAGGVFVYYGWNIRKDAPASTHPQMKIFVWTAALLVFAAMAWGFYSAGSPQAERIRRFDERRIFDLQQIQWQIINYWQAKEKLPVALEDLRDTISGFVPPVDPEVGTSYEYRATGELNFELCAVFKAVSFDSDLRQGKSRPPIPAAIDGQYQVSDVWAHNAGRTCFERKIDPELYSSFEKPKR